MQLRKQLGLLAVVLGTLSQTVSAQGQPESSVEDPIDLVQATQMLRDGRGTQVYNSLLSHAFARAGDPDFDYLLGAAALEAGHADAATLALERVLAVSPNHGAARLDMGRAYFALGDMQRARRELGLARTLNPPAAARAILERYLAEITARETAPATRTTAYLEAGLGSDDNVTQGPVSNTSYLPAFGVNFTMNAANQKKGDGFSQINAGVELSHRIDEKVSLYGGIDAKARGYSQVSSFDSSSTDLRAGVQWQIGQDTWRAGLGYNHYVLGQQPYRNITSLGGEFRRALTQRQQIMGFGQAATVRYVPDAQVNNDVNQWVAGAGWVTQVQASSPTVVTLSAYAGQELEAKESTPRIDGNKDFLGTRAAVQMTWRADLDVYASAGLQAGGYQRTNSLYQVKRTDALYELALGAVWRFAPAWNLKPQLNWLHNSSNISVNEYQRYEVSLMIRRDFQ